MGFDVKHLNCGSIQSPTNTPREKRDLTQVFALPWIRKDLEETHNDQTSANWASEQQSCKFFFQTFGKSDAPVLSIFVKIFLPKDMSLSENT